MKQDIREKIALKRYQIISPVLAEPKRAQNEYFRQQAQANTTFRTTAERKSASPPSRVGSASIARGASIR
jgi:hypothetical protein